MNSNTLITTQQVGAVLTLGMNRPEKKNALNLAMYQSLTQALQHAKQDPNIHVVVLRGVDGAFSAGNDLADFLSAGPLDAEHPTVQFLHALHQFPKPLIAAVDGLAVGIGTTALLHCDLVYATDRCHFAMPFTKLGLCPEAASSLLLPKLMGYQKAAQYLLLGESFDTATALQFGLVNQRCDLADLYSVVAEKAAQLASLPHQAVLESKALLKRSTSLLVNDVMHHELSVFEQLLKSPACQQALQSFYQQKPKK